MLGELYASQGLRSRAASMFRRVLELKPDGTRRRRLAGLGPDDSPAEPEDDRGGFIKKLFGER